MNKFRDLLRRMRTDSNVDLYGYSRENMLAFFDTVKKSSRSALQEEVIQMDIKEAKKLDESEDKAIDRIYNMMRSAINSPYLPDRKKFREKIREILRTLAPITFSAEVEGFKFPSDFFCIPGSWLPTSRNVNELPEAVRSYIHSLETVCDPAGMVRENVIMKDTIKSLERRNEEEDPEFPDDPDRDEMETGIHYEILLKWKDSSLEVVKGLNKLMERIKEGQVRLFVCVPQKFAGAALVLDAKWSKDFAQMSAPSRLYLVSTGKCFEISKNIKLQRSDKIYVFAGEEILFAVSDFDLQRKSEVIVYRSE